MARFWFWKKPPPTPPPTPPPSSQDETRNQVDYISQLPAIILHILSFLTTKDAVKTSILWRDTWTSNPHISFSMPSGSIWMVKSFMAFMDAVLLLCTAIKLTSFLFNAPYCASLHFDDAPLWASLESSIDRWLHFAVGHNVEKVSLILNSSRCHNTYVLRQFLFRCPSLVLSLTEARGVFLPYLECRHLMFPIAADEVPSIAKILESSPRLEKLFLKRTYYTRNLVFIGENVRHRNFDVEEVWNSVERRIYMHLKNVKVDYDVY